MRTCLLTAALAGFSAYCTAGVPDDVASGAVAALDLSGEAVEGGGLVGLAWDPLQEWAPGRRLRPC